MCQHITVSDSGNSMDVYIYQGIMVKMDMTMSSGGVTTIMHLTVSNTNIT